MKIISLAMATAMVVFGQSAMAQEMSAEDFVAAAASSDMFEIQSSELAQEKSQTTEITEFAEMMIADHSKASEELKAAASTAGVEVPAEMMEKHAAKVAELEGLEANEFDAAYVAAQVTAHEEALALKEGYAEKGEEEALKAHAAKTAPVIKTHYEHVQEISAAN
jgi:putative membrane protein